MVRFVAMTPELFDMLPLAGDFGAAMAVQLGTARTHICTAPNVALAMLDGGDVLGAGGVAKIWQGRGFAWMLPGARMTRRHFALATARCLMEIERLHTAGVWRIECTVLTGDSLRAQFVRRMGFRFEGTMCGYGANGTNHDLWAKLPPTHSERCSLTERLAA